MDAENAAEGEEENDYELDKIKIKKSTDRIEKPKAKAPRKCLELITPVAVPI
jgi:hypothetical protein